MAEEINSVQTSLNQTGEKVVALKSALLMEEAPFEIGEKVVHPAHGVGVVQEIQSRVVSSWEQKFYQIIILDTNMKIMVPVAQAMSVGLRRIVGLAVVDEVYDILRDRNVVINSQTWNRRHREYNQKIKTGSLFEIAKVVRDLSVLRSNKELSYGERAMLDTARGRLVKEIAIAVSRPEDTVLAELKEICQTTPQ